MSLTFKDYLINESVDTQEAATQLGLELSQSAMGKQYSRDGARLSVMEDSQWAPRRHSVTDFVVPESARGKGVGKQLLADVLSLYNPAEISAACSSEASVALFYGNGFRPFNNPTATLKDAFARMVEYSSVTMVIP